MIDNRAKGLKPLSQNEIKALCDRRFGIGADGFILLEKLEGYDFHMVYYNSDGRESTMCGNGGRCITRFAQDLGIVKDQYSFLAIDGPHEAYIKDGLVSLKMKDVEQVEQVGQDLFADTGSPHHIVFDKDLEQLDIITEARKIRYNDHYRAEGVNVNFIKIMDDRLDMRTYERGVEDETYSCGTGVTAAVLASHYSGKANSNSVAVKTRGGDLSVTFNKTDKGYTDIWLTGPAEYVFEGEVEL